MHEPFDLDAGTRGFYEDPIYYDHEFKNRTQDVAWYTDRYVEAGAVCLELAVGSGRIAARPYARAPASWASTSAPRCWPRPSAAAAPCR
ncbi:MAG: hypothetical protein R3F43_16830 [bacterium]